MKHHHLTLYKGQVWGSETYHDLCQNNILYVTSHEVVEGLGLRGQSNEKIEQNNQLYVSHVPGWGFSHDASMTVMHSEILQSFAELTNSADNMYLTDHYTNNHKVSIYVGQFKFMFNGQLQMLDQLYHEMQSLPPNLYFREYIWTKEGFKLN